MSAASCQMFSNHGTVDPGSLAGRDVIMEQRKLHRLEWPFSRGKRWPGRGQSAGGTVSRASHRASHRSRESSGPPTPPPPPTLSGEPWGRPSWTCTFMKSPLIGHHQGGRHWPPPRTRRLLKHLEGRQSKDMRGQCTFMTESGLRGEKSHPRRILLFFFQLA